jgi:hypothetical protein
METEHQTSAPARAVVLSAMHLEVDWLSPGAQRTIQITGALGGKHIAVTVPSA